MARWIGFHILIGFLLILDLGVFHRKKHKVEFREALAWSGFWICLALLFNGMIFWMDGAERGLEFFTGYVIEKSLSVDNLFIFWVIFSHFKVPAKHQHKVLFYGIIGALVMRLSLILAGVTLIYYFHFIFYLFAVILGFTGLRLIFQKEKGVDMEDRFIVQTARKILPITHEYHEGRFTIYRAGKRFFTPLFLALVIVECTDLIFALDSIPAIFAITLDPFIIYSSNVFAILGLRSLYFALAHFIERFHYLKMGLGAILLFIAAKMALVDVYKIPLGASLGVIALILLVSICFSLRKKKKT